MAGDQPPVSLEHRRRRRKRAEIAEQVEVPRAEIPEDDRMSDTMEQVDSGSKEQSDSPATQVNEISSSNLADNEKSSSSPSVRFIQVLFECSFFFTGTSIFLSGGFCPKVVRLDGRKQRW